MIEFDRIRKVMEEMGTAFAPMKIIRSDQNGPRPDYPVATYKVMQLIGWQPQQYFITEKPKEGDATMIEREKFETIKVMISLNFIGLGAPDALYTAAGKARAWLDSQVGEDFCETKDISPRILGEISDRSVLIETHNEQRIGFDVRLDCDNVTKEEIEALLNMVLNNTTTDLAELGEDEEE